MIRIGSRDQEVLSFFLRVGKKLEEFNRLRSVEAMQKLEGSLFDRDVSGGALEVLRMLVVPTGLAVDVPLPMPESLACWSRSPVRIAGKGIRMSHFGAIQECLKEGGVGLIIDTDRIRVVSHEEARRYWRDWLTSCQK
jgi:hypothetical protein